MDHPADHPWESAPPPEAAGPYYYNKSPLTGERGEGGARPPSRSTEDLAEDLGELLRRARAKEPLKSIVACENKAWTVAYWPKGHNDQVRLRVFKCRNWRHPGECRLWKGAQDFVRIRDGLKARSGWLYVVLTFDPAKSKNEWAAYRSGVHKWDRLRKRLTRLYGRIEYVQTWESTRKGWPHVNLVIHNEKLLEAYRTDPAAVERWFKDTAASCGFGWNVYLQEVYGQDSMAGYMTKLSRELVGAQHKDQVPENAPRHFRRIRASRGLLPPPHENPDVTGCLFMRPAAEVARDLVVDLGNEEVYSSLEKAAGERAAEKQSCDGSAHIAGPAPTIACTPARPAASGRRTSPTCSSRLGRLISSPQRLSRREHYQLAGSPDPPSGLLGPSP
ncbi:MAG: hypothetical protein ACREIL_10450 [Nitrospiraceae bacterium]